MLYEGFTVIRLYAGSISFTVRRLYEGFTVIRL
jgi:hypothetical protein